MWRAGRTLLVVLVAVSGFGLPTARAEPTGPAAAGAPTGPAARTSDFNGDGFADAAVGVPGEAIGSTPRAGAVNVLYGSASGLSSASNQLWYQGNSGIGNTAEAGDEFGFALATGDFNGDGFADLAIGVPGEDFSGLTDAGSVEVLMGSSTGLTATGNVLWSEDTSGVPGAAASNDQFGASLATGDFNGDGFADLVVGEPGKTVSGHALAGAAVVLPGSATGLSAAGSQLWSQDSSGIPNAAETDDHFGFAVSAGDFNGDGFADLAAGVPGENSNGGSVPDGGTVNVIYGSATGLASVGAQAWSLGSTGVPGSAAAQDDYGYSLAAGDFDGDGHGDLAVGVPFKDSGGNRDSGAVSVLYGSATGLASAKSQLWALNSASIPGPLQSYASFGFALATGDVDGDSFSDLAVGDPGEAVNGHDRTGAANVLYGSSSGLTANRAQFWTLDVSGVAGATQTGAEAGFAVAVADTGVTSQSDLILGVPGQNVSGAASAGAVVVLYGSSTGVAAAGSQQWTQDSAGIAGTAEGGDDLGFSLGAGGHGAALGGARATPRR